MLPFLEKQILKIKLKKENNKLTNLRNTGNFSSLSFLDLSVSALEKLLCQVMSVRMINSYFISSGSIGGCDGVIVGVTDANGVEAAERDGVKGTAELDDVGVAGIGGVAVSDGLEWVAATGKLDGVEAADELDGVAATFGLVGIKVAD